MKTRPSRRWTASLVGLFVLTVTALHAQEPSFTCDGDRSSILDVPNPAFPGWSARVENVWMKRQERTDQVFATFQQTGTTNFFARTIDSINFDYEPGLRVTLSRAFDCGTAFETTFWGLHHWNSSDVITNGPITILQGSFDPALINPVTSQFISYSANFDSAEVNIRHYIYEYPHISVLFGLRYMHLDETFTLIETGTGRDITNAVVPVGGTRQFETENEMFGGQLGVDVVYPVRRFFEIGTNAKLGILGDYASVRLNQAVTNSTAGPLARFSKRDRFEGTGLVEAAMYANFWLTRQLVVRAGYQVVWMPGVALASEQSAVPVNMPGDQQLDVEGELFMHGPFLAIEFRWGGCY